MSIAWAPIPARNDVARFCQVLHVKQDQQEWSPTIVLLHIVDFADRTLAGVWGGWMGWVGKQTAEVHPEFSARTCISLASCILR